MLVTILALTVAAMTNATEMSPDILYSILHEEEIPPGIKYSISHEDDVSISLDLESQFLKTVSELYPHNNNKSFDIAFIGAIDYNSPCVDIDLASGGVLRRYAIQIPIASRISVIITNIEMECNERMFLYDDNMNFIFGPIKDSSKIAEIGKMGTPFIRSNMLYIEITRDDSETIKSTFIIPTIYCNMKR